MQFYRCKCGKSTAWTSMGVSACSNCDSCGSDFAQSPEQHEAPAEHKYVTRYDSLTGAPYEMCRVCMEQKPVPCRGCGKPLVRENKRTADGCPCNGPRGLNHGLVAKATCTCTVCDPAQTGSTRYYP